jgi:hypothetical protein
MIAAQGQKLDRHFNSKKTCGASGIAIADGLSVGIDWTVSNEHGLSGVSRDDLPAK